MSIYTSDDIQKARQKIGKLYEKQIGEPSPMLPDALAILTSPDILPALEELIAVVKSQDLAKSD